MPSSSSPGTMIKGFLPVRLQLPNTSTKVSSGSNNRDSQSSSKNETTYFFVKEHQGKQFDHNPQDDEADDVTELIRRKQTKQATLFIANAPVAPGVSTKLLLTSLFSRFAKVTRVTVVHHPHHVSSKNGDTTPRNAREFDSKNSGSFFSDVWKRPSYFPPILSSEGKFAHVVFETPKGMKKALRSLRQNQTPKEEETNASPLLTLDSLEIQTLADESMRLYKEKRRSDLGRQDEEDDEEDERTMLSLKQQQKPTGILAVAERFRSSCCELSRDEMMEECNRIMGEYEETEAAKQRTQLDASNQPDDDGFVTVGHAGMTSTVDGTNELETDLTTAAASSGATNSVRRRRGHQQRRRRKKEAHGAQEQQNFYRFQRRENKKRTLDELRAQFEEDLSRVKRLKEDKKYKPF